MILITYDCEQPTNTTGDDGSLTSPIIEKLYKFYSIIPYNGLFSLGANFPEWWTFSFSRNFPDLEIHDTDNEKLTWATFRAGFT